MMTQRQLRTVDKRLRESLDILIEDCGGDILRAAIALFIHASQREKLACPGCSAGYVADILEGAAMRGVMPKHGAPVGNILPTIVDNVIFEGVAAVDAAEAMVDAAQAGATTH